MPSLECTFENVTQSVASIVIDYVIQQTLRSYYIQTLLCISKIQSW